MTVIPRPTLRSLRCVIARACSIPRSRVRLAVRDHTDPGVDDGRPMHSLGVTITGPQSDFIGVMVFDGDGRPAVRHLSRQVWRSGSVWGPSGPPEPIDFAALRWKVAR